MKRGVYGLAGAAVFPQMKEDYQVGHGKEKPHKSGRIERTLGKTGLKVPVVSFGCGRSNDSALFQAALDGGITYLDTAQAYANGRNEHEVGRAVRGRPRDTFILGTKIYTQQDNRTGQYPEKTNPRVFHHKFEQSLKRLGQEYVDILFMHDVVRREAVLYEPLLQAMEEIKKSGRARFLGVSFHRNEPELLHAAADSGVYDVVLTAYNFRQPQREQVKEAVAYAAGKGLGVVAMKVMAGAYLDRNRQDPVDPKAALKWVLQDENVHTTIPGISNLGQLQADLEVLKDLALTPEEERSLARDMVDDNTAGLYCAQCGRCAEQCPAGLNIPALMRGYMYAFGYGDLRTAWKTVRGLEELPPCGYCEPCRVTCTMGFDVKSRIQDIAGIRAVPEMFLTG